MRPLVAVVLLAACQSEDDPEPTPVVDACGDAGSTWGPIVPGPRDGDLDLSMVQARATHNSYHQQPESVIDASWGYTQPPLTDQLGMYGVRGLELDVHLLDDGGWEVFHIPGLDDLTSCRALDDCLHEICAWSAANPSHAPVMVWIEPKDDTTALLAEYQPITGHYAELEDRIRAYFPPDRLYVPDDWRRGAADLRTASATQGPPLLGDVRGKVLFGLLDSGDHRDAYLAESPDLAGRILFPDSSGAEPYSALVKDATPEEIGGLVELGLVVTGNVDGAGEPDNAATRDAALAAGIQYAASDFPAPSDGYWMELPDADPVRCNPAFAPDDCVPSDLEAP